MHACTLKIQPRCLEQVCRWVIIWISNFATRKFIVFYVLLSWESEVEVMEKSYDNHLAFVIFDYFPNWSLYWHYVLTKKVDSTFLLLQILRVVWLTNTAVLQCVSCSVDLSLFTVNEVAPQVRQCVLEQKSPSGDWMHFPGISGENCREQ